MGSGRCSRSRANDERPHTRRDGDSRMAAKHSADGTNSTGVEAPDLEAAAAAAPRHGFFVRLYTGTGAFEVVGRRKMWFTISGVIVAVAIASIVLRGFTFGIDFDGGTKVSMPAAGANGTIS